MLLVTPAILACATHPRRQRTPVCAADVEKAVGFAKKVCEASDRVACVIAWELVEELSAELDRQTVDFVTKSYL
jgi:hypothetical protein